MQNVMIVEDHPFVADAMRALISQMPGVGEVVTHGTAGEVMDALAARRAHWSLILLDLEGAGAVGLFLVAHILQIGLAPITCILTDDDREDQVEQIRDGGFVGYLLKSWSTAEMFEALTAVFARRKFFPCTAEGPLTRRQREILQMVALGMTSKEIAQQLGSTPGSINNHIMASIAALNARTRSEAVTKALMLGLVRSEA
jgi:DNA-binding NarL/FixJ family response regulator